jgi:3-hydroxybutyryl-CoA dehydratase
MTSRLSEYLWEDLQVGLKHEFQATISEEMMTRFRLDIGDTNPLHVDTAYARANGFDGRVVYGMLVASFYSTLAGVHLPGRYCLLHGINVSFVKPVFVGDHLTVCGEVVYLNDAYHQAHISAHIAKDDGTVVSKAKLVAGVLVSGRKT